MRKLDENTITAAVLESLDGTRDLRVKQVTAAHVEHLHDFARAISLTPEEWLAGIALLTQVGQKCTSTRQEFILLSDILGLSTLVDSMRNRHQDGGTPSTVFGPFYREGVPLMELGGSIARNAKHPVLVKGRIRNTQGDPVAGAEIEVWQASPEGFYDIQLPDPTIIDLRGRFRTDASGEYRFVSEMPKGYPIPTDGPVGRILHALGRHPNRPAHIHFLIRATGFDELVTALYIADDPYIGQDAVFGDSAPLAVAVGAPAQEAPDMPCIQYDFCLVRTAEPQAGTVRVGADPAALMAG
jgi:hydroxyquinol 1,2-dioxygenase